jgi:hypothetical protein
LPVLAAIFATGCISCTEEVPLYCDKYKPCKAGFTCDHEINTCIPAEAGVPDVGIDASADSSPSDANTDTLRGNGSSCTTSGQCLSGECVDSVCCDTNCAEACKACNLKGTVGTCSVVADGTTCGAGSCSGSTLSTSTCQKGTCTAGSAPCPGALKCDSAGKGCLSACSSLSDCVSKTFCAKGECLDWVVKKTGTTPLFSLGVWGSSSQNVWMTKSTNFLHYDGSSWKSVSSGQNGQLFGLWGTSQSNVWAAGYGGIFHYDGSKWSKSKQTMWAMGFVWGSSKNDVWAVGAAMGLEHYNGTVWKTISSDNDSDSYSGIWGTSSSDIWITTGKGKIEHYNGTKWSATPTGITSNLTAIWGSSASDIWAGGLDVLLHWDGTKWSKVNVQLNTFVMDIWGTSASNVWLVGYQGVIFHYDGTTWKKVKSNTTEDLMGIWGSSPSDIWISGDAVLHSE